MKNMQFFQSYV